MTHITITGFSSTFPAKANVCVGSVLTLTAEDNPNDPDAIAAYLGDITEGNQVGYVSQSASTTLAGCKKATQLKPALDRGKLTAKVLREDSVPINLRNGGTRNSKAFYCEVIKEIIKEQNMDKTLVLNLAGANSNYRAKLPVLQRMSDGVTKPSAKFVYENSPDGWQIIVYVDNAPVGYVASVEGGVLKEDLIEYVKKEARAGQITNKVGTNMKAVLVFNSEDGTQNTFDEIKDIEASLIKEGILTKEEVDERVQFASANGISQVLLAKVFKSMCKYPDIVAKKIPYPKTKYVDNGSGRTKRCVAYILNKRNLMFDGDRGVGKNVLAETLAWFFNRPLFETSLNSGQDNTSLLGGKTFDDSIKDSPEEAISFFKKISTLIKTGFGLKNLFRHDASNDEAQLTVEVLKEFASLFSGTKKLKFEPEAIVLAAEYGGIIVLDEFNTIMGHIMAVLNSLLDDRRRIQVPGYKSIEAHPNFIAIATENSGYQATFENNEATEDRFVWIRFNTLSSISDILRAKVPSVNPDDLDNCEAVFKAIKDNVDNQVFESKVISIRGFIDALNATKFGIPLQEALIDCVANKMSENTHREAVESIISDKCGEV